MRRDHPYLCTRISAQARGTLASHTVWLLDLFGQYGIKERNIDTFSYFVLKILLIFAFVIIIQTP